GRADHPAGAYPVLDHHGLAEPCLQPLGEQPCQDIVSAADGLRDNDGDAAGREVVAASALARCGKQQGGKHERSEQGPPTHHRVSIVRHHGGRRLESQLLSVCHPRPRQNGTTMPSSGASQFTRSTRLEAIRMPPSACTRWWNAVPANSRWLSRRYSIITNFERTVQAWVLLSSIETLAMMRLVRDRGSCE